MAKKQAEAKEQPAAVDTAYVEVRASNIHATGCFARCNIPQGARVIEYVGPKLTKAESLRECENENVYVFTLNDEFDINGNVEWNPARFINHSCEPNCEAENDGDHIWILALRDIRPGEELTYNYGFDLEEYKDYPCLCGSPRCVGFMVAEEYFDHARKYRELQQQTAEMLAAGVI